MSGQFRFSQVEIPWALGPPDGRYLVRSPGQRPGSPPSHVLVVATLGAPERRWRDRRGRARPAAPEPEPAPVTTGRATVIDVSGPLAADAAERWLAAAGEAEIDASLRVLDRALHAFRLVTADPSVPPVTRERLLVARVGTGAGEEVADGRWTAARELTAAVPRRRRSAVIEPQARLAGALNGTEPLLACQTLTLRARDDLDAGRDREAALGLPVALAAALAELPRDGTGAALTERLSELAGLEDLAAEASRRALAGRLADRDREAVDRCLGRLEAALRARAAVSG